VREILTYTTLEPKKVKKKKLLRNNEYYNIQNTFDMLYKKGTENHKFNNLMQYILSEQNILLAYRNIKKNKGSKTSGTDKKTILDLGDCETYRIVNMVRHKLRNYRPYSVRRVDIPKPNGKTRPLGIPTISDRLIQQCIKQVLEPICESKFHKHSYGFRPNRSIHDAISRAMSLINRNKLHYVVDIHIKGFFDNVNHGKLLKQIWNLGIQDKELICIISKMLKSEIEGIGKPTKGPPQGGILSPLLSNIVLNELDWCISDQWESFETKHDNSYIGKNGNVQVHNKYTMLKKYSKLKEMYIVRYCDDFKIFCRDHMAAQKIYNAVRLWLKERLLLDISPDKSRITNLRKNYTEFLGFKLKAKIKGTKFVCKSHISDKAKNKIVMKLKEKIREIKKQPIIKNVGKLNSTILGMHNYYRCATHVNLDFNKINFLVSKTLYNQLKTISTVKGNKSGAFQKFYGKYNMKTYFIGGIGIFPVAGIRTKPPMNFSQNICNYTIEGRKRIHKTLQYIDKNILKYLMENTIPNQSTEYNDNRISLYVGQNGKCGLTSKRLEINDMEVHHKTPKLQGGKDEYSNLLYVTYNVHKIIHATEMQTINKYMKMENLDKKALKKLNLLRKKVGNYVI